MTNWIRCIEPSGCPDELGVLQLAWLGDAVWELYQRRRFCKQPAKGQDLHLSVVSLVKAEAQARALENLKSSLTDIERKLVRRGRNRVGRGTRKVNILFIVRQLDSKHLSGGYF